METEAKRILGIVPEIPVEGKLLRHGPAANPDDFNQALTDFLDNPGIPGRKPTIKNILGTIATTSKDANRKELASLLIKNLVDDAPVTQQFAPRKGSYYTSLGDVIHNAEPNTQRVMLSRPASGDVLKSFDGLNEKTVLHEALHLLDMQQGVKQLPRSTYDALNSLRDVLGKDDISVEQMSGLGKSPRLEMLARGLTEPDIINALKRQPAMEFMQVLRGLFGIPFTKNRYTEVSNELRGTVFGEQ